MDKEAKELLVIMIQGVSGAGTRRRAGGAAGGG